MLDLDGVFVGPRPEDEPGRHEEKPDPELLLTLRTLPMAGPGAVLAEVLRPSRQHTRTPQEGAGGRQAYRLPARRWRTYTFPTSTSDAPAPAPPAMRRPAYRWSGAKCAHDVTSVNVANRWSRHSASRPFAMIV